MLITSLSIFSLISWGYIGYQSYADTIYVLLIAMLDLQPAIVHRFRYDTGLMGIAVMDKKMFGKYKHPLILLHHSTANYQVGLGVLELYILCFKQSMIFDMVIFKTMKMDLERN